MSEENNEVLPLSKVNYKLIAIGCIIEVVGFILMLGGKAEDPTVFNYDEIFSPMRITVAPTLLLIGLGVVLYGIMKKPAQE